MKKTFLFLTMMFVLLSNILSAQSTDKIINKETVLIVLDVQKAYVESNLDKVNADAFIEKVNDFLLLIDDNNVVYIKSVIKTLSISFKGLKTDTVAGMELFEGLEIKGDNIFEKEKADAFTVVALCKYINDVGAKRIIIVGLLAEQCVYHTALGGLAKGYEIILVPKVIVGKKEKSKNKYFEKLKEKGVKFVDYDSLLNLN